MAGRPSGRVWTRGMSGADQAGSLDERSPHDRRLARLLTDMRAGHSRALVICGAGGAGKTLLLSRLSAAAEDMPVLRASGVPFEAATPFSSLHQLLMPVLGAVGGLPAAHRHAVTAAFGPSKKPKAEAALVDGASVWRTFWSVIVPLIRPALAALATLEFPFIYNDYFWAIVLMQTGSKRPITSSLSNLQGLFFTDNNLIAAGAVLVALPTIIVYLLLQRHFVRGLTLGAAKG